MKEDDLWTHPQNSPSCSEACVFNEDTMQQRLSSASYHAWKKCVTDGTSLDISIANEIAEAMKQWAVEKGCTHFTHWFQPMTGITAEKHDSFIAPVGRRQASSWTSPAKSWCGANRTPPPSPPAASAPPSRPGATPRGTPRPSPSSRTTRLCIPTVFCSYSGEALDKKTPLLRSMEAVSRQAAAHSAPLRRHGNVRHVVTQVGAEQEYFLIDKDDCAKREDLRLCGRTLFGAKPPKGQELDDHYFGAIRPRVAAFMKDLDDGAVEGRRATPRPSTTRSPPVSTRWRRSTATPTAPATRTSWSWS
jgi:glutamine synthetase